MHISVGNVDILPYAQLPRAGVSLAGYLGAHGLPILRTLNVVNAPRNEECYANLECKVIDPKLASKYNIFIREVVKAWIDRSYRIFVPKFFACLSKLPRGATIGFIADTMASDERSN